MFDPAQQFTLAGIPQVSVYPDTGDPARFAVVPTVPRIARDEAGAPLVSLLIYRRRGADGQMHPIGGQFLLTTTLALVPGERDALRDALRERLRPVAPDARAPPEPELLAPDWVRGQVAVQLTTTLALAGTPSLMGANECAMSLNLDADGARDLQRAWHDGLRGATVRYDVEIRAMNTTTAGAGYDATTETVRPGRTARSAAYVTAGMRVGEPYPYHLTVAGPLVLTPTIRDRSLQTLDL